MNRRQMLAWGSAALFGGVAGCSSGSESPETQQSPGTQNPEGSSTSMSTPDPFEKSADEEDEEELMKLADPPDEIVMVNAPVTGKTPYLLEAGLFEKRGLNVRVTENPVFDFSQNIQLMVTGKTDYSSETSAVSGINLAREQDRFIKQVFPMLFIDTDQGYLGSTWTIVHEDSDIESYADMEGKTLATLGGSAEDQVGARWHAEQAGINPESITLTDRIPLSQAVQAVVQGEVDAATSIEPRIIAAIAEGAPVRRLVQENKHLEADSGGYVAGWWTNDEFYQNYPYTVKLMQRAMAEGLQHIYDPNHQDDYIATVAKTLRVDEEVARIKVEQKFETKPVESVKGSRLWESVERIQDHLIEYTPISERIDVDKLFLPWDRP